MGYLGGGTILLQDRAGRNTTSAGSWCTDPLRSQTANLLHCRRLLHAAILNMSIAICNLQSSHRHEVRSSPDVINRSLIFFCTPKGHPVFALAERKSETQIKPEVPCAAG